MIAIAFIVLGFVVVGYLLLAHSQSGQLRPQTEAPNANATLGADQPGFDTSGSNIAQAGLPAGGAVGQFVTPSTLAEVAAHPEARSGREHF